MNERASEERQSEHAQQCTRTRIQKEIEGTRNFATFVVLSCVYVMLCYVIGVTLCFAMPPLVGCCQPELALSNWLCPCIVSCIDVVGTISGLSQQQGFMVWCLAYALLVFLITVGIYYKTSWDFPTNAQDLANQWINTPVVDTTQLQANSVVRSLSWWTLCCQQFSVSLGSIWIRPTLKEENWCFLAVSLYQQILSSRRSVMWRHLENCPGIKKENSVEVNTAKR